MSDSFTYIKHLEEENLKLQQANVKTQQLERQTKILKSCFIISQIIVKEQIYKDNSIGFEQYMNSYKIALHPDYLIESEMEPKFTEQKYYELIKEFIKRLDDV